MQCNCLKYNYLIFRTPHKYYVNGKYTSIGSTICGTQYDVAHVKWGGKWRMPTIDELKELKEKCTWTWTTQNGVKGMRVTGPNGYSIFLPAAGYRLGFDVLNTGVSGYYWSGSLNEDNRGNAWTLGFLNGGSHYWYYFSRYVGFPVRPVLEENLNQDRDVHGEEQTVDLGLSIKWATCNVGASAPEGIGSFYAWGETEEKSNYNWSTYIHCDGTYKTCHNIGSSICGTQYDVAHVKWGGKWRMPTLAEQQELVNKCTWAWTTLNDVKGMKVTGPNGNSIFLPAAGTRFGTGVYYTGNHGGYWSGSLYEGYESDAWTLFFNYNGSYYWGYNGRGDGFPVRPVFVDTPNNDRGGHDVKQTVDLGLSVKWASCNVGASTPEGTGGYYAWGETEEKSKYDRDTYKYYADGKYTNIGSSICGTQYDVAHVKWGGKWRMPTSAEQQELVNKCTWTWTTLNGVEGMKVTGPNGNSIFLPAAGYRGGSGVLSTGDVGIYWSGSLDESSEGDAWYLGFGLNGYSSWYDFNRIDGFPVRPVSE